ncbi:hypothetical protein EAE96_007427 [Botrytis aclada]|nr:hypothetical protein EAE96_007427 [Botrytis aclada]
MRQREYIKVRNKYGSGYTVEISSADDLKAVREAQENVRKFESVAQQEANTTTITPVISPQVKIHQASNSLGRHSTYSSRQDSVHIERQKRKRTRFEKEKQLDYLGSMIHCPALFVQIDSEDHLKYFFSTKASPL